MQIQAVYAVDDNNGIGKDNGLPWPFNRKDMQNFVKETSNTILVMGSNTWYSLPNKLKGRVHVVLSRSLKEDLIHKGEMPDHVINSELNLDKIQEEVTIVSRMYQIPLISIIGGKQTYERLLPITDYIIETHIVGSYECDTILDIDKVTDFEVFTEQTLEVGKLYVTKYRRKLT